MHEMHAKNDWNILCKPEFGIHKQKLQLFRCVFHLLHDEFCSLSNAEFHLDFSSVTFGCERKHTPTIQWNSFVWYKFCICFCCKSISTYMKMLLDLRWINFIYPYLRARIASIFYLHFWIPEGVYFSLFFSFSSTHMVCTQCLCIFPVWIEIYGKMINEWMLRPMVIVIHYSFPIHIEALFVAYALSKNTHVITVCKGTNKKAFGKNDFLSFDTEKRGHSKKRA